MRSIAMKRLWAVAREYGVTSEELHQMSENELGKEHISKLSEAELKYLTYRIEGKMPPVPGQISPGQTAYIRRLEKALGWDNNEKRLSGFIDKYAKGKNVETLSMQEASRIIEGLKKLVERMDAG